MKRLAPWAWLIVLGTALSLSWWSLDALALSFGVPEVLAAMVSATFDGAALVAADLALRRAALADSALSVKLLMLVAVGLSAWLNYEHASLLGYPLAARVLFAAPSGLSGWLFELQLRSLRRDRLHETGRIAKPMPQFGLVVWVFHPFAALLHLSRIAGSRLRSVPVTVMDWDFAPTSAQVTAGVPNHPVILAAPVEAEANEAGELEVPEPDDESDQDNAVAAEAPETETRPVSRRAGRSRVPDELYLVGLQELVDEAGGAVPSARQVARRLGIGQDRARRLIASLKEE